MLYLVETEFEVPQDQREGKTRHGPILAGLSDEAIVSRVVKAASFDALTDPNNEKAGSFDYGMFSRPTNMAPR